MTYALRNGFFPWTCAERACGRQAESKYKGSWILRLQRRRRKGLKTLIFERGQPISFRLRPAISPLLSGRQTPFQTDYWDSRRLA
jgi:hypothetical protein